MHNLMDLTGKKFGRYPNKWGNAMWLCRCECGTKKVICGQNLTRGDTKSCGCLQRELASAKMKLTPSKKLINIKGKRFGELIVIRRDFSDPRSKTKAMWLCKCDCGEYKIIDGGALRYGRTKSCGCLRNKRTKLANMRNLFGHYKRGAKRRGYKFELTEKQFVEITKKDCFYCGAKPNNICKYYRNKDDVFIYNGIDRIDNTKGYTIDNVVACCKTCNQAKSNLPLQEFKNWVEKVYNKMFIKNKVR